MLVYSTNPNIKFYKPKFYKFYKPKQKAEKIEVPTNSESKYFKALNCEYLSRFVAQGKQK